MNTSCFSRTLIALLVSSSLTQGALASEKEEPIGKIQWAISETAWNKQLSSGEKTLRKSDIALIEKGDLYNKRIDLSDDFTFNIVDSTGRTANDKSGFGLTCGRKTEETFCWEWFEIDRPGHAKKLQESGELAISFEKSPTGVEIKKIEFLSDVSMRVNLAKDWNPFAVKWRIKIFKGTVITWPSCRVLKGKHG